MVLAAKDVRQEDIDEWVAGTGEALGRSLQATLERSLLVRCVVRGGVTLAMWGCTPTERGDTRQVWFVAAREAPRHAITIHRHFQAAIAEMHAVGFALRAYSWWRNIKHHRWLEAHGFVLQGVHTSPATGIPFLSFIRSSD